MIVGGAGRRDRPRRRVAYTYKTFVAPGGGRRAPVVSRPRLRPRSKPSSPTARVPPHRQEAAEPARRRRRRARTSRRRRNRAADGSGARKVDELPTAAQGAIPIPPQARRRSHAAAPPARPADASSVPGVTVVENFGSAAADAAAAAAPPSAAAQPPPAPAGRSRRRQAAQQVSRRWRRRTTDRQPAAMPAPSPACGPEAAVPRRRRCPEEDRPRRRPALRRRPRHSGQRLRGGAVVEESRMDALKTFADLQQKYGDVLASKTPDVQEANLGEQGRLLPPVVGPPGSRERRQRAVQRSSRPPATRIAG